MGLGALALFGCRSSGGADGASVVYRDRFRGSTPNLAMGAHPDDLWLAEGLTMRGDWPAVDFGYRFDDVSSYAEVLFDNQYGFDRFGGTFRSGQNIRTGVLVR